MEDFADRLGTNHTRQAVRAEQPPVALDGFPNGFVQRNVRGRIAQYAKKNAALGVGLGLLWGELPGLYQVLHKRVVGSYLRKRSLAQQVRPRIANVSHGQLVAAAQNSDTSSAEAMQIGIVGRTVNQFLVRVRNAGAQQVQQVVGAVGVSVQIRQVCHRDRRGNVAARRPAHAIGKHQQVRSGVTGILIRLPHQPHIRAGSKTQSKTHRVSSNVVCPILIWFPNPTGRGEEMRSPSTKTPFVEFMSSTCQDPPAKYRRACWEDA